MIELIWLLAQASTPPAQCHPSYPNHCLPIDRRINCSGIPDNKKPVRVTGPDYHGLDRDKDGLGCEVPTGNRKPKSQQENEETTPKGVKNRIITS
jgi:hypothetical protein